MEIPSKMSTTPIPKVELKKEVPKREVIMSTYRPSITSQRLLIHLGSTIYPVYCKEGQTIGGLKSILAKLLVSKREKTVDPLTIVFADKRDGRMTGDDSKRVSNYFHVTNCDVFAFRNVPNK